MTFMAMFLGRRLEYTYEVREHIPPQRFAMSTADGPFPMETTCSWEETPGGTTLMTLRNRGEPAGFAKVGALVMRRAIARESQGPGAAQGDPRTKLLSAVAALSRVRLRPRRSGARRRSRPSRSVLGTRQS